MHERRKPLQLEQASGAGKRSGIVVPFSCSVTFRAVNQQEKISAFSVQSFLVTNSFGLSVGLYCHEVLLRPISLISLKHVVHHEYVRIGKPRITCLSGSGFQLLFLGRNYSKLRSYGQRDPLVETLV